MKFLVPAAAVALCVALAAPSQAGWGCHSRNQRSSCGSHGGYATAHYSQRVASSSCGSHGGYARQSSACSPCGGSYATTSNGYGHGSYGGVTYASASQGDCGCDGSTGSYQSWSGSASGSSMTPTPADGGYESAPQPPTPPSPTPPSPGQSGPGQSGGGQPGGSQQQGDDALKL
ncbi:hypothetical protein [Botrimarina sp.]|uniref:hypothetical protein n=1 Tax=Botrimarina sp. TaxID=2795802 RepID=UPI0032EFEA3C